MNYNMIFEQILEHISLLNEVLKGHVLPEFFRHFFWQLIGLAADPNAENMFNGKERGVDKYSIK